MTVHAINRICAQLGQAYGKWVLFDTSVAGRFYFCLAEGMRRLKGDINPNQPAADHEIIHLWGLRFREIISTLNFEIEDRYRKRGGGNAFRNGKMVG